jgi:(1->4)-alpha-D-glucan 1-alpha-D-glucosylmutase
MLGTSTHDTKRGEDVRARLAVLSEMPEEWQHHVLIWHRILRARVGDLEGTAPPDLNDEYLFYQLLLGAWPAELTGRTDLDPDAVAAFTERLEGAMVKSMREAKLHSTWASPNPAYEDAMLGLVRAALDTRGPNALLDSFLPFQERIAKLGVSNSLVQTALKLTLPGMPDIYQGAELWDLSLVDPDNRRPVDYATRERLLAESQAMPGMLENWRDGRVKLALTAALLAERRKHPLLFADGGYAPLVVSGPKADQVCAFARTHEASALLVIAARFPARLKADPDWAGTEVAWPEIDPASPLRDLLTGRVIETASAPVRDLLGDMPVAVFARDE